MPAAVEALRRATIESEVARGIARGMVRRPAEATVRDMAGNIVDKFCWGMRSGGVWWWWW